MSSLLADIPSGVRGFLAVLAVLVVVFSSVPLVARFAAPGKDMGDYWDRTRGWWIVCSVGVLGVLGGPDALRTLLGGVVALALLELLALVRPAPNRAVRGAALVATVGGYGLFAWELGPSWLPCALPALLVPAAALLGSEPEQISGRVGGVLLACGLAATLAPLALLLTVSSPVGGWAGWFLYVLFVAQMNDLWQYCAGRLFGRHPIAPRVSPKKTWEGFVGGWLCTVGTAVLVAPLLVPLGPIPAAVLGALIAPLGLLGDLTVSAWKRSSGAAVTGALLPGFGGVLDRFDSLIYVAPLAAAALGLGWL